jgi:CrcB protein
MRLLGYVMLGGALGTLARYFLSTWIHTKTGSAFPLGTLFINVSGSILLGLILRFALETPAVTPDMRAFLTTGLCGGYTTFSTFSYETAALIEDGDWKRAGAYVGLSVLLSIGGMFLGFAGARELLALRRSI